MTSDSLFAPSLYTCSNLCLFDLLLKYAFQSDRISGKLRDAFSKLIASHRFFIEVETEFWLVIEIALPLNVER